MIAPHEITVTTIDGDEKKYLLHRFDCITAREVLTQYPTTGAPSTGKYEDNQKLMLKVLSFVCAVVDDKKIKLDSETLIKNHVPDGETLLRIEYEMFKYNYSFFQKGDVFDVLTQLISKVQSNNNTQTSTDLSEL